MKTTRWDLLATRLAQPQSRRSSLRLLWLALLGGSLVPSADLAIAKDGESKHGHRAEYHKPDGRKKKVKTSHDQRGHKHVSAQVSGGTAVPQGKYPFAAHVQASVVDENSSQPGDGYTYSCSGSLIDRSHILTAAHCVFNQNTGRRYALDAFTVVVGQVDRTATKCMQCRKRVTKVEVSDLATDIAVLTLDSPVAPSVARPIPLIFTNQHSLDGAGQFATVAGWGITTTDGDAPKVLREAQLIVQSDAACAKATGELPEFHLCTAVTNGRDACSGDSGAPLFVKHDAFAGGVVQIGVVTRGPAGCPSASSKYGQMYTRLSHFIVNTFIRDAAPEVGGSTACTACRVGDTCCPPSPGFPRGFCAPRGVACPPVGASPEPPPPACATCKPSQRCCPRSPQFPDGLCVAAAAACPPSGAVRSARQGNQARAADAKVTKRAKGHGRAGARRTKRTGK